MYSFKNLVFPCLVFCLTFSLQAQDERCAEHLRSEADIKVFSPQILPNPLPAVADGIDGNIRFMVSNDNGQYQPGDLQLILKLSDLVAVGELQSLQSNYPDQLWEWSLNGENNVFIGELVRPIEGRYAELFSLGIKPTVNSLREAKSNGFSLEAIVNRADVCNASIKNDVIERRTYTNLTSFNPVNAELFGQQVNDKVDLQWNVKDAEMLREITIQHSTDGNTWTALGTITNHEKLQFEDLNPSQRNLYRLELEQIDREIRFSNVVEVHLLTDQSLSVFPNPVSSHFFVAGLKDSEYAVVYDELGRKIQQVVPAANRVDLSQHTANKLNIVHFSSDGSVLSSQTIIRH